MRQKAQHPNIDAQWFKDKLREHQLSIRKVAKLMGKDPTTTSFLLRGIRRAQQEDVVLLARLFNVSTGEIRRRYGEGDGDVYAEKLREIWRIAVNACATEPNPEFKKALSKISQLAWVQP